MKKIAGRTAVVTGAARGLGKAIASHLLAKGGRVALVDVQADVLAATAESLALQGVCRPFACDISDPAAVRGLADDVEAALLPVNAMDRLNAFMGMWHINDGWRGGSARPG